MSWSFSVSGHFTGDDAPQKEAALQELAREFVAAVDAMEDGQKTSGTLYGQHVGSVTFPEPAPDETVVKVEAPPPEDPSG